MNLNKFLHRIEKEKEDPIGLNISSFLLPTSGHIEIATSTTVVSYSCQYSSSYYQVVAQKEEEKEYRVNK